jgi:lipid-A-disaccharide synthase
MKAFLIAGEPSGDRLGGALMAGLSELFPGVTFDGIGGPEMTARGLTSRFPMEELSVMGIAEVLSRYRALKRRIRQCAEWVVETRPDVLVTIDSPDFCLRVARLVRAAAPGQRIVHYVAPSVWAWRPGRAAKMAPHVDQVLCLLPFEPPYMKAAGMEADFVGHPVVAEPQASAAEIAGFRAAHGVGDGPLVLVLPGSRRGEVGRLADPFGEVLEAVAARHPGLRVVVPTTRGAAETLIPFLDKWPGRPILLDPRTDPDHAVAKRAAFGAADVALAASGTVSLELAAAGTPMVIAYDMNWISRTIIQAMVRIDTATLVNLVSETRAVPEFLGARCKPELIAPALLELIAAPEGQRAALETTMERLGRGGEPPGLRAARAVIARLVAAREAPES